jgi:hypothetical protein
LQALSTFLVSLGLLVADATVQGPLWARAGEQVGDRPTTDSPSSPQGRVEAERRRLNEFVAIELAAHADWCQENKAFLERDEAWQVVLMFRPDDADARKWLGYKLDKKTREWVRDRPYRAPRASNAEIAAVAAARRAAIVNPHRDRVLAAIEAAEPLPRALRATILGELLGLMPGDDLVHERMGHVRLAGSDGEAPRWVMAESARALLWRQKLRKRRAELYADLPPARACALDADERKFGVEWAATAEIDGVRVLSTGEMSEVKQISEACHVMWEFTADLLSHDKQPRHAVHVLASTKDRDAYLDTVTARDPQQGASLRTRYSGYYFESSQVIAVWWDSTEQRVDMACRYSLALLFGRRFGVWAKHGWALEGFGVYLTERLIGTRLTWFLLESKYVGDESGTRRQMMGPNSDWLVLARQKLDATPPPNLAFLFGRDVNALTPTDMLFSYTLAAFLLEGHEPQVTEEILRRTGDGENSLVVVEEVLGYDLQTLVQRLRQWLAETGK